jgi:hypothetical protein
LEAQLIFRSATILLGVAFALGLVMAGIRFGTDKASPPWMPKVHGYAAVAALALLGFGWAHLPLTRAASFGVLAILAAAATGVFLNLGYRWKQRPLPEWLVFVHMSIAFVGFLAVGMVLLSMSA